MQLELSLARGGASVFVILLAILAFAVIRGLLYRWKKKKDRQAWMDYDLSEHKHRMRSSAPIIETIEAKSSPVCPVCEHRIDDQPRRCPRCGQEHHPECWTLNDGCGRCGEKS